jgi:hypothetical protein
MGQCFIKKNMPRHFSDRGKHLLIRDSFIPQALDKSHARSPGCHPDAL